MPERPSRGACPIADLGTFAAVRDLIEERCGLRFDDSQRASLSASVSARMQQLGVASQDEYVDRLRGDASRLVEAELKNLLNLVTVTETCFFRDAAQFHLLREHIIPTLISERTAKGDSTRSIRIWSAGCSSGEEAYSIALTLEDMGVHVIYPGWTIEIVGTDLNTKVLEKARTGVYSPRAVRNIEGRLLNLYFKRCGESYALNDEVKRYVTFEYGNLTQIPMPSTGPQDVVFCKNVTIYFRNDVTRKLIRGLHDTLAPDGYLLLGHAESLWQMSEGFTLVEHERAFCYRKSTNVAQASGNAAAAQERRGPAVKRALKAKGVKRVARDMARVSEDYNLCLAAFRAGDWDRAEAALSALVASCPTFVPGLLLLGGLYANRGRFDEAVGQAESVLRVSDLEPRAHLLLGMIAARQHRPEQALQSLRRALYLDDSLALGHFWLGNLYRDRGDLVRACLEYENVVRDWERHTLEFTVEFATDLTVEQLVGFCSDSLERLQTANGKRE
jgi:chemotaxis protein methyltransferase CheR